MPQPKPIPVNDPVNPQPMHPAKEKISSWLNSYMPSIMNKITAGAAKPTDVSGATAEPGVSKMLYEAVHPDTFNRVMDLFGGSKPTRLLDDGTQDDPLRPGESAIVGGRGPERLAIDTGGAAHVQPLQSRTGNLMGAEQVFPGGPPESTPGAPQNFRESLVGRAMKPIGDAFSNWNASREREWRASQGLAPLPEQDRGEAGMQLMGNTGSVIDMKKDPTTGGWVAPPYPGAAPGTQDWRGRTESPPSPLGGGGGGGAPPGIDWQGFGGWNEPETAATRAGDEQARQRIAREGRGNVPIPGQGPGPGGSYLRSYYEAHPEERAKDELAALNAPPRGMAEYERNAARMRMSPEERLQQDKLEADQRKQYISEAGATERARMEHGPGSPSSQEKLAHAEYLKKYPEVEASKISLQGQYHLAVADKEVQGHLDAAKIAAEPKDLMMKEINSALIQGVKNRDMYGTGYDPTRITADIIKQYKAVGKISQKEWDALPEEYKKEPWTEKSLRQDLKANNMSDSDIESYLKRAKAAGRI